MKQTTCDICGGNEYPLMRCFIPMYQTYTMQELSGKIVKFEQVEVTKVNLCNRCCYSIADFIKFYKG